MLARNLLLFCLTNKDEFVRDSVDFLPDSDWRARFERVLQHATQCVIASTHKFALGSVSYDFGNELLFGLATIHTRRLETSLVPLAVWDGICSDGPVGTATAVENWRSHGYRPEIIDLTEFSPSLSKFDKASTRDETSGVVQSKESNAFPSRVVAVLFADAVGFSKLTEDEVPRFVQHFLWCNRKLNREIRRIRCREEYPGRWSLRCPVGCLLRGRVRTSAGSPRLLNRLGAKRPAAWLKPAYPPSCRSGLRI
jgi:hypothetical protein